MLESDLKRYLIKSIRSQGGYGHRFEDRFSVGFPDCVFIPKDSPVFFIEAKICRGAKLVATQIQTHNIGMLFRPPYCYSAVIGFKDGELYIGQPEQPLHTCAHITRPHKLDSADWGISELLIGYLMALTNKNKSVNVNVLKGARHESHPGPKGRSANDTETGAD